MSSSGRFVLTLGKGVTLCPDMNCAAIGDAHKMGCKAQQIEKQRTINRSYAVGKSFESILAGNRTRANEIRLTFKKVAKEKTLTYCLKYNAKGVPCADGRCRYYPAPTGLRVALYTRSRRATAGSRTPSTRTCPAR